MAMSKLSFREYLLSRRRSFTAAGAHLNELIKNSDFLAVQQLVISKRSSPNIISSRMQSSTPAFSGALIWSLGNDGHSNRLVGFRTTNRKQTVALSRVPVRSALYA